MKRLTAVLVTLALVGGLLAGCGGETKAPQSSPESGKQTTAPSSTQKESQPAQTDSKPAAGGMALQQVRKAAEAAGYTVRDDYVNFLKDVTGGFSVQVNADNQDVIYAVLECATVEAADKNVKEINAAGHNFAVRSGRIISFYNVDNKGKLHEEIVRSIVNGKPIPKP
ncbi:MAG TPA: hypothetical protein VD902_11105 [Symbiobacteriaceae bacterium]|nr:hypothetical protein [Symbiobacteriaceae bacterium]